MYVTDALKAITKNMTSHEKTELTMRYMDLINPKKPEERSEEEIVEGLKQKLKGLK